MPTLDDLHEALRDREMYAGDPEVVLRALQDRQSARVRRGARTPPARWHRHMVGAAASAGVVAALAVALAIVVGAGHGPTRHEATQAAASGPPSMSITGPSGTSSAPTTAANAVPAHFTIDSIPGYSITYGATASGQETATVTSQSDASITARVSAYEKGQFDPSAVPHGDIIDDGAHLANAHEHRAVLWMFVARRSAPTLYWTYAANSWASVAVSGVAGTQTSTGKPTTTGAANAMRIASLVLNAVHVNGGTPGVLNR